MLQSELDGKRVVVALGGNALGDAPGEQLKLLEGASKNLARMVKEGINVVVTHGNGPQVGIIDEAFEVASKDKDAPGAAYAAFRLQRHEPGIHRRSTLLRAAQRVSPAGYHARGGQCADPCGGRRR